MEEVDEASRELLDAADRIRAAEERADAMEQLAADASERMAEAALGAADALDDAAEAAVEANAAREAATHAEYATMLAERREERAKSKAKRLEERLRRAEPISTLRSADEWARLSREAFWKACQRDRIYLKSIFSDSRFRMEDLAAVLADFDLLEKLLDSPAGFAAYYARVEKLVTIMERDDYGMNFALYLHYECHLTLPKILQITQAACKRYIRSTDRHVAKELLCHRHVKGKLIKVPRLSPPISKLVPAIRSVEARLGVMPAENGRLALRSVTAVFQEMMVSDPGSWDMPALPAFLGGAMDVPIIVQFDGTGFGNLALNTIALRNPYAPQSAQQLHILGVGKSKDDKAGVTAGLGSNLAVLNSWITATSPTAFELQCGECKIKPEVFVSLDVAALRHTEHMTNSGWCGCSRDFALRVTPAKPATPAAMHTLLEKCVAHKREARFVLGHNTIPGEDLPPPCTAIGCTFAHNRQTAAQEQKEMLEMEAKLEEDQSKKGRARFSKWRCEHAKAHMNVTPGNYAIPPHPTPLHTTPRDTTS